MTQGNSNKFVSNDYADLLINYSGDTLVLEQYKDYDVHIINFFIALVHVPVSQMTEDIISKIGYATIPSLYGLISEVSLESSGVFQLRNIPNFNLRGRGVLIGIVDSGIDYTNPIFQYADLTTRIVSIWDQTIAYNESPSSVSYGTEYSREEINNALKSEEPFSIVPTKDEIGHGTMLAGIAAGNEVPESGFYGVAPEAELVIVKLKPAKPYLKKFFRIPEDAISYQENDILFGFQYTLNVASKLNMPIVLCNAVDTSQYAHDGRDIISSWLSLQANTIGVAILIAVGNEGNARRHYSGLIDTATGYNVVELNVGPSESGFSMELWGPSPNIFSLDITSPSGEYVPRIDIRMNETRKITFIFEATIIYLDYVMVEAQSGDQLILLRFSIPSQGIWKFKVYGAGINPMIFNIWLPMDGYITTDTFFIRSDPSITLLSLACAVTPIAITAYNTEDDSLYLDAGRGYTRTDYIKPEIAAPGVNVLAPARDHSFTTVTGTSAAVAHVAGVAAMLLEWGIVNGKYPKMNTQDMKIFMIRGARRDIEIKYPNQDWGYGILDIFNIFDIIRGE